MPEWYYDAATYFLNGKPSARFEHCIRYFILSGECSLSTVIIGQAEWWSLNHRSVQEQLGDLELFLYDKNSQPERRDKLT